MSLSYHGRLGSGSVYTKLTHYQYQRLAIRLRVAGL